MSNEAAEQNKRILLLSDDPLQEIWTYLSIWESEVQAGSLIRQKAQLRALSLDGSLIASKARSLAYCIRNARECIAPIQNEFIPRIMARYYGCMWIISAIMISDPTNTYNLDYIEQQTKQGHGLANITDNSCGFPNSEYIYIRESGLFSAYLEYLGLKKNEIQEICPLKKVISFDKTSPSDRGNLISLTDVLSRIPEIKNYYTEIAALPMQCFHVCHSIRNIDERSDRAWTSKECDSESHNDNYTWIQIINSAALSLDEVKETGLPFSEIEQYSSRQNDPQDWTGKLIHTEQYWWEKLDLHKSAMAPTTWIKPLKEKIVDYLALHFMALYCLSILARYRPSTWREVTEGNYNQYRVLFSAYLQVFERVMPEIALKKITGRRIQPVQQGSFNAPI